MAAGDADHYSADMKFIHSSLIVMFMLASCESQNVEILSVRRNPYDSPCKVGFIVHNKLNERVTAEIQITAYHSSYHTGDADVKDKVGEVRFQQVLAPQQEIQLEKEVPSIGGLRCDSVYVTAKADKAL